MYCDLSPSQRRAHLFIGFAVVTLVVCFGACYALWIHHGCRAFLPFISDLGLYGAMQTLFVGGLMVASVFMLCALPHIVGARRHLLSHLQVDSRWQKINILVGLGGAATACGVGLLGFFPWDRALMWHLLTADVIFGCGTVWTIGSWVLARRFASALQGAAAQHTWQSCARLRRLQLPVAAATLVDLGLASVFFLGAVASDHSIFTKEGLKTTLRLALDDFDGYCTGDRGWHGLFWVNMVAATEWILVSLLAIGVILATADLEAHLCVRRNIHTILPAPGADQEGAWWRFW